METKPFDLYGDEPSHPTDNGSSALQSSFPSNDILIEYDLSKPLTLMEMIGKFRDKTETASDNASVTLYFVTGTTFSCKDVNLFIDYLNSLTIEFRVVLRGFVHFEFIRILWLFPNLIVDSNLKVVYSKPQLHNCLKQLLSNTDVFRRFITRFSETYHKLEDGTELDLTELTAIGINVQTI